MEVEEVDAYHACQSCAFWEHMQEGKQDLFVGFEDIGGEKMDWSLLDNV